VKIKNVEWSLRAAAALDYYCKRIALDSPRSAKMVRKEIVKSVSKLSANPTLYQIDEYYPNNNGDIRRFFRWSYRIVYQIRDTKVVVLNIFQTGMDSKNLK
jgi:plasmid stabilization system protein ParE